MFGFTNTVKIRLVSFKQVTYKSVTMVDKLFIDLRLKYLINV